MTGLNRRDRIVKFLETVSARFAKPAIRRQALQQEKMS